MSSGRTLFLNTTTTTTTTDPLDLVGWNLSTAPRSNLLAGNSSAGCAWQTRTSVTKRKYLNIFNGLVSHCLAVCRCGRIGYLYFRLWLLATELFARSPRVCFLLHSHSLPWGAQPTSLCLHRACCCPKCPHLSYVCCPVLPSVGAHCPPEWLPPLLHSSSSTSSARNPGKENASASESNTPCYMWKCSSVQLPIPHCSLLHYSEIHWDTW